jgi:hypothetical protein
VQDAPASNPMLTAPLRQALGGKAGPGGNAASKAAALYARMSQVASAIVQVRWDVPSVLPSCPGLGRLGARAQRLKQTQRQGRSERGRAMHQTLGHTKALTAEVLELLPT